MEFITHLLERLKLEQQEADHLTQEEERLRREWDEKLRAIAEAQERARMRVRHIQALLALEGHSQLVPELVGVAQTMPIPVSIAPFPSLADYAYQFLAETGRECHYKELAEQLMARGVSIPGKEPANNLVARICTDPRLVRPRRGFYGLREWYASDMRSVGARTPRNKGKAQEEVVRRRKRAIRT